MALPWARMSFVKFLALFLVGFEQEEITELPWVVWGFSATGRECRSGVSQGDSADSSVLIKSQKTHFDEMVILIDY